MTILFEEYTAVTELSDRVTALEELALNSTGDNPDFSILNRDSTSFDGYLNMMGLTEEIFFEYIDKATQNQGQYPVIVADVGGNSGTAANDLNLSLTENGERIFEAFQIDKSPAILQQEKALPLNRHIKADANHMPEVPDDSFHMLFSFNALSYTDVSKSLPEIKRVLRPGGVALLDIEFWYKSKDYNRILNSELADEIKILVKDIEPFYFSKVRERIKSFDKKQLWNVTSGRSCFIIEKD